MKYVGSKNRLAKQLAPIIQSYVDNPNCKGYIDGKWFGGYPRGFKEDKVTPRDIVNETIRNLKKQALNLKNITFRSRDFRTIKPEKVSNYVIYCDPPYRDTTKYATDSFPYDEFYEWCRKMSENNIVLISEYWMPDDFECIWEGKLKCTLDKDSRTDKVERLFKWKGANNVQD